MKQYDKYKEIPAPWLSKIPIHWSFRKIRYAFNERSEKGYPHEPLLSATQSHGVIPQALHESRMVSASKDFHLLKLVEVGDFVISLRSFQGGIEYAYYRGIISPAYTIMSPRDIIDSGYFRYLAKSEDFIRLLQTCVTGIREGQNIDYKTLRRNVMPIPPKGEQEQIVRYLNWKVSLINKFVKEKKREVALLKELKNAEINHAVTRGLNPEIPLNDSGIEWIGQIPEHWDCERITTQFIENRNLNSKLEYNNALKFQFGTLAAKIDMGASENYNETYTKYTVIKDNDIVINGLNLNYDFVTQRVAIATECGIITSAYIVISPRKSSNSAFFCYFFKSMDSRKLLNGMGTGIRLTLSFAELKKQYIPIPSSAEQQQIVSYIADKEEKINKAISDIEREIALVKEYKARLISDVVTGKVDVREIVVPDFQSESEVVETTEEETDEQTELN